jgi:hypothetical protein
MRRRYQRFLPIVLIALMVQIFAPVAACWAAAIAASDPLGAAEICHDASSGTTGQPTDQSGQHREHGGVCSTCCLASASTSVDTPAPAALAKPYRDPARVIWYEQAPDFSGTRIGSNAQARAPPSVS